MANNDNEKVTIRFESTMESDLSEPLLLSGPIQIFQWVDYFDDLTSTVSKSETTLMGLINETNEETLPSIVVFVNGVSNTDAEVNENSQPNRGAYFLFTGDRHARSCNAVTDWQEILLGTHSHHNKEQLDSLENIQVGEFKETDKIVAYDEQGNFKLVDLENGRKELPPLPIEVQNYLHQLEIESKFTDERGREFIRPDDTSGHHLDFEFVSDTYDWLRPDKDGNYTNLNYAHCKDLYYSLIRANKKLYLKRTEKNKFDITREKTDIFLALEIYDVNFNLNKKIEGKTNFEQDPFNKNKLLLTLDVPFVLEGTDEIFIFVGGNYITSDYYNIIKNKDSVSLTILKDSLSNFVRNDDTITLLFLRGNGTQNIIRGEISTALSNRDFYLEEIHTELIKLYIEGEFNKKPQFNKNYYLTADSEGTIYWDNKILPTQYFYQKSITISEATINAFMEGDDIVLRFPDVYFDVNDNDYPILMVDNYFAFDLIGKPDGKDFVYTLTKGNKYIDWLEDELIGADETTVFTLIVIKNSAGGSLAAEIADRYVSKEDAVKILSHGKINLKDYARSVELIGYSRINHTHSEYALANHNHDYKYAGYHHSHPELCAILATNTGLNKNDVETWVNKLTGGTKALVEKVENELIVNKKLKAQNIYVSEDVLTEINAKIKKDGIEKILPLLNGNVTLDTAINYIVKFFEIEYVTADKVLLPEKLIVTNKVGGITRNSYNTTDSMYDIIRDLLNPLIDAKTVREHLIPSDKFTKIEFYRIDSTGFYAEKINPSEIKAWYEHGQTLLFKILPKNKFGEECKFVNSSGIIQKPQLIVKDSNDNEFDIENFLYNGTNIKDKFYVYSRDFDFYSEEDYLAEIKISWLDEKVYDSYGNDFTTLNPSNDFIKIVTQFEFLYPDYYAGCILEKEFNEEFKDRTIDFVDMLKPYTGSNELTFNLQSNNLEDPLFDYITILLYQEYGVSYEFIDENGYNVFPFFEDKINKQYVYIDIGNRTYCLYYYKVLYESNELKNIKLKIKQIKKEV